MTHPPRRLTAALAVTAVAAAGLTTLTFPVAHAAPPYDADAPGSGAGWLAGELDGGLLPGQFGSVDYGLTIDAGLALIATGGSAAAVDAIDTAVAADVDDYVSYAFQDESEVPADPEPEYYGDDAGDTAKAAVFARAAGSDPSAYGGIDLVGRLESLTDPSGRTFDTAQGEPDFSLGNSIGQSFAVRALDEADSAEADAATSFLLDQQCPEGFFRLGFSPEDAADRTCDDDPGARPSTDATALAVLMLQGQADDPHVGSALDTAVTWLRDSQRPDGSFLSDDLITEPNANSTGLAGWALGEGGATRAAEKAAVWLRGHQLVNAGICRPYARADEGAIAYGDAALATAAAGPVPTELGDQFRRATAQALPALRWAPDGVRSEVTSTDRFVRAGSTQTLVVAASPGDLVCVAGAGDSRSERVGALGKARVDLVMPRRTGTATYRVADGDEALGASSYRVLARTTFPVALRARAARGTRLAVRVRGLEPGERATVSFRGRRVGVDRAGSRGKAVVRFVVRGGTGAATVRATGGFGNRRGTDTFRVTR